MNRSPLLSERIRLVLLASAGQSYKQVRRYIRLTQLSSELLQMVDDKKVAFNPTVELLYFPVCSCPMAD